MVENIKARLVRSIFSLILLFFMKNSTSTSGLKFGKEKMVYW